MFDDIVQVLQMIILILSIIDKMKISFKKPFKKTPFIFHGEVSLKINNSI